MASDASRTTLRGLLIPHQDWTPDNIWSAQSSYTQASPVPGQATPTVDTSMVLRSSGEAVAGTSLVILGQRAGYAEPDSGSIVWRNSTDGTAEYRGWDPPHLITAWEAITWIDGGGSPTSATMPHVVGLSEGTAVVAYQATVGSNYVVQTRTRAGTGTSWASAVTVYTASGTTAPDGLHPCMVVLPDGRILLFHLHYDSTRTVYQLRMWYSDDEGATWTLGSTAALKHSTTAGTLSNVYGINVASSIGAGNAGIDIQRMRAAYRDGQIVLFVSGIAHNSTPTSQAVYLQYASRDLGGTFTLVEQGSSSTYHAYIDVVATPAGFVAAYLIGGGAMRVVRWTNAFEGISIQTEVSVTGIANDLGTVNGGGKYYDDADVAIVRDTDQALYVLARTRAVDNQASLIVTSTDYGDTWVVMSDGSELTNTGAWWSSFDSSTYVKNYAAAAVQGRILVVHQWNADPGDEDASIGAIYLGGWSIVTMPGLEQYPRGSRRVGWDRTWLAIEEPGDCGWTASGAGTDTLGSGYLTVTTTGLQQRYYSLTGPGGASPSEGIILRAAMQRVSGGSLTANNMAVCAEVGDGALQYRIDIRVASTGFRVIDSVSAATLTTVTTALCDTGIEFLVAIKGDDATSNYRVWYRAKTTDPDRAWVLASSGDNVLTRGAAGTVQVLWGNGLSAPVAGESRWWELHLVWNSYTGLHLAQGQTNPTDLFGRSLSPEPVWVEDGLHVAAVDGPIYQGDTWTLATAYRYPVSGLFPSSSPTPSVGWRSTSTAEATIAIQADANAEEKLGSDILGLYLDGCNWRTGKLQGYDVGTAAWVDLATIDMATGLSSLPFTRLGSEVHPSATSNTAAQLIRWNEFAGGTFDLSGGDLRTIERHTEGLWTDRTTRRPVVYLENVDPTDAGSGTGAIWSPRALVLVHLAGATYQGFRLKIDSQSTVAGYHTVAVALLGWVQAFGPEYSWGRVSQVEPNVEITESRSGRRRSRRNGEPLRSVEFGWIQGVDLTDVSGSTPDGDYLLGTSTGGADPVALAYDAHTPMDLLAELGGHSLVVYCPTIPKGTPNTVVYTSRERFLYGRIVGSGSMEVVLGEESSSEVVRVPALRIEGER